MDKIQIYLAMGNILSYCEYLEKELEQKDIANKIREELESIKQYILEK